MASPDHSSDYHPGGRPLTGRKVFAMLAAFFGLIIAMNFGVLLPQAIATFRGLETDSAYRVSQQYNAELARAAEQAARGWTIEAEVTRDADGHAVARVSARDREGRVLPAMEGEAVLARPADRNLDRTTHLNLVGHGRYEARFENVPPGQWDIVLSFSESGERVFHSRNRIVLR